MLYSKTQSSLTSLNQGLPVHYHSQKKLNNAEVSARGLCVVGQRGLWVLGVRKKKYTIFL